MELRGCHQELLRYFCPSPDKVDQFFILKEHSQSCLGRARNIPTNKVNDKTDMNNDRPISLLSVVSKGFERIMYSRIIDFMGTFLMLNYSQFGIRSKRSCVDAIAQIVERVRHGPHKTGYTCFFFDLTKPFATDPTLQKNDNIGMRKNFELAPTLPAM